MKKSKTVETSSTNSCNNTLCVVTDLRHNDVLLGRGAGSINYVGNVLFREIVKERREEYMSAGRRQQKDDIARSIVDIVKSKNGRFLQKVEPKKKNSNNSSNSSNNKDYNDNDVKEWIVADDEKMLEKVKQSLRDREYNPPHRTSPNATLSSTALTMKPEQANEPPTNTNISIRTVSSHTIGETSSAVYHHQHQHHHHHQLQQQQQQQQRTGAGMAQDSITALTLSERILTQQMILSYAAAGLISNNCRNNNASSHNNNNNCHDNNNNIARMSRPKSTAPFLIQQLQRQSLEQEKYNHQHQNLSERVFPGQHERKAEDWLLLSTQMNHPVSMPSSTSSSQETLCHQNNNNNSNNTNTTNDTNYINNTFGTRGDLERILRWNQINQLMNHHTSQPQPQSQQNHRHLSDATTTTTPQLQRSGQRELLLFPAPVDTLLGHQQLQHQQGQGQGQGQHVPAPTTSSMQQILACDQNYPTSFIRSGTFEHQQEQLQNYISSGRLRLGLSPEQQQQLQQQLPQVLSNTNVVRQESVVLNRKRKSEEQHMN